MANSYTGVGYPSSSNTYTNGDTYLDTTTQIIYFFDGTNWSTTGITIMGGSAGNSVTSNNNAGIATTGYVSAIGSSSITGSLRIKGTNGIENRKLKVTPLGKLRYRINNLTIKNREIYQWLMNTDHDYEVLEGDIIYEYLEIEFKDIDGSMEFKITWCDVYSKD